MEKVNFQNIHTNYYFLIFIVIGYSVKLEAVLDFSDMMILTILFPNVIGLLILSKEVKIDLDSYLYRLNSGQIKEYKKD